jgi:hypothetical protein
VCDADYECRAQAGVTSTVVEQGVPGRLLSCHTSSVMQAAETCAKFAEERS